MSETSKARVTITLGRGGQVFFFFFFFFFSLKIRVFSFPFLFILKNEVMICFNGRLYCCLERNLIFIVCVVLEKNCRNRNYFFKKKKNTGNNASMIRRYLAGIV
jgi:hypothetical protein